MFAFVLLICMTLFGASMQECTLTPENFMVEEYACTHLFCGELDKSLIEDYEKCCANDPQVFKDAYDQCFELIGLGGRSFYEFMTSVCTNEGNRQVYLNCMRGYAYRPGFTKAVIDGHTASERCYDTIWQKHGKTKQQMIDLYFKCT